MKRRDVLSLSGTIAIAGLAGCLTERIAEPGGSADPGGDGDSPENDSPEPDDRASTPSDADGSGESPELVDSSFEVVGKGPGDGSYGAGITFDEVVTVEGEIRGNNGCYSAELVDADVGNGTLRVLVRSFDDSEGGEMCTQQIVGVEYEATFEFDRALPDRVVVEHDVAGEVRTVSEAAHGSETASDS